MNKKIILASASPRRKELLENIGLKFEVIPSGIDENIENKPFSFAKRECSKSLKGGFAGLEDFCAAHFFELIENIAFEKVLDVKEKIHYPAIIIGSDTVVIINNKILGKPENKEDAFNMLKLLSGKTHRVISAIAVYDTETKKVIKDSVMSEVTFRKLDNQEIQSYIESGEPMDKAGAYGIQKKGAMLVEKINGCYFNVMGISVVKLYEILKEFGVKLL